MRSLTKSQRIAVFVGGTVIFAFLLIGGISFEIPLFNLGGDNMNKDVEISDVLSIDDVVVGDGAEAKQGDTVIVHYVGTFPDGVKFDSSLDRGESFSFVLGSGTVIQGWDLGVAGMREGGKRTLVIPPDLAYGSQDYGPIPANSTLHFEVNLLEVVPQ
jgi:FKBP-type peptidyl-prolyl cis-trans isomerase